MDHQHALKVRLSAATCVAREEPDEFLGAKTALGEPAFVIDDSRQAAEGSKFTLAAVGRMMMAAMPPSGLDALREAYRSVTPYQQTQN